MNFYKDRWYLIKEQANFFAITDIQAGGDAKPINQSTTRIVPLLGPGLLSGEGPYVPDAGYTHTKKYIKHKSTTYFINIV